MKIIKITVEKLDDKKERNHGFYNRFIIAIIELAKAYVYDEVFDEYAEEYKKFLLGTSYERKQAFVRSFTMSVEDAVEDIVGLVVERKNYSLGQRNSDKKKEDKKNY